MKKVIILIAVCLLFSCGTPNMAIQLSKADDDLSATTATKVYAGYDFAVFRLKINNVIYLVNSEGGIIKE